MSKRRGWQRAGICLPGSGEGRRSEQGSHHEGDGCPEQLKNSMPLAMLKKTLQGRPRPRAQFAAGRSVRNVGFVSPPENVAASLRDHVSCSARRAGSAQRARFLCLTGRHQAPARLVDEVEESVVKSWVSRGSLESRSHGCATSSRARDHPSRSLAHGAIARVACCGKRGCRRHVIEWRTAIQW
jgi:hypothetical protein